MFEVVSEAIVTLNDFAILMTDTFHRAVDCLDVETSCCTNSDPPNVATGLVSFPNQSSYSVAGLESEDILCQLGFSGRKA